MAHIKTGADSIVHVLYHFPCPDGVFAALAAFLRFRNKVKSLTFVPHSVYTSLEVNNFPPTSHTYLLDYTGKDSFAFDLAQRVQKVTIIDHHKTAIDYFQKNQIPTNMHVNFADDKSGATLALDHFSKEDNLFEDININSQERIKRLYSYIEDNDLWTLKLPDARHFSSGLSTLKIQYDPNINPNVFEQLMRLDADELIEKGKISTAEQDSIIQKELDQSFEITLGEEEEKEEKEEKEKEEKEEKEKEERRHCLAVMSSYPELRSSLGHQLALKSFHSHLRGIGCIVYTQPERPNEYKVSMRSIDEDTTKVSTKYGGGGHRSASSFFISKNDFEKWKIVN